MKSAKTKPHTHASHKWQTIKSSSLSEINANLSSKLSQLLNYNWTQFCREQIDSTELKASISCLPKFVHSFF